MGADHDRASGSLARVELHVRRGAGRRHALGRAADGAAHRRALLPGGRLHAVGRRGPGVGRARAGAPAAGPAHRVVSRRARRYACWCESPGQPARAARAPATSWSCRTATPTRSRASRGCARGSASPTRCSGSARWRRAGCPSSSARAATGRSASSMVCGFLGCDALPFNPVLATLPRLLRVPAAAGDGDDRLGAAARVCAGRVPGASGRRTVGAAAHRRAGVRRGAAARTSPACRATPAAGWPGLRDPLVGRALAACTRRRPSAGRWSGSPTTPACRAPSLAERFAAFTGMPPMHYLLRWRMQVAATRLGQPELTVAAVAAAVGYDSEAAFSRAFKRCTGVPPVDGGLRAPGRGRRRLASPRRSRRQRRPTAG